MKILSQNNGKAMVKISKEEWIFLAQKQGLTKEAAMTGWLGGLGKGIGDAVKGVGQAVGQGVRNVGAETQVGSVLQDVNKLAHTVSATITNLQSAVKNPGKYQDFYNKILQSVVAMQQAYNQSVYSLGLATPPRTGEGVDTKKQQEQTQQKPEYQQKIIENLLGNKFRNDTQAWNFLRNAPAEKTQALQNYFKSKQPAQQTTAKQPAQQVAAQSVIDDKMLKLSAVETQKAQEYINLWNAISAQQIPFVAEFLNAHFPNVVKRFTLTSMLPATQKPKGMTPRIKQKQPAEVPAQNPAANAAVGNLAGAGQEAINQAQQAQEAAKQEAAYETSLASSDYLNNKLSIVLAEKLKK